MIKAIILDFDGIILETNRIKLNGFLHLFRDYPLKIRRRIRDLHLNNGGVSRFKKFRIIYHEFLKAPLIPKEEKRLGEEFSSYCFQQVLKAPYVKGIKVFLNWAYRRYNLFIVSATPEAEIREIVKRRKLNKFFKSVYGSPHPKEALCRKIIKKNKFKKEDVLFIGDSLSDLRGAEANQVDFVVRIHEDNKKLFKNKEILRIKNFVNFPARLRKSYEEK